MKHYQVTISDDAKQDLRDIQHYIRHDLAAPEAAKSTVKKISSSSLSLAIFPERGSVIERLSTDHLIFRQLIVGHYRIIYRVLEEMDEVLIVRILYTARAIRL